MWPLKANTGCSNQDTTIQTSLPLPIITVVHTCTLWWELGDSNIIFQVLLPLFCKLDSPKHYRMIFNKQSNTFLEHSLLAQVCVICANSFTQLLMCCVQTEHKHPPTATIWVEGKGESQAMDHYKQKSETINVYRITHMRTTY